MFNRIVVPLDRSSLAECVLPHVVAVARPSGANVTLVHVLDPVSQNTRPQTVDPFDWQIRKAEAETYLKDIAQKLADSDLSVERVILEGKGAERIVEYAHNQDADLIVMSSHGQSGISGWNVSSVVQKVILRAQTSIMIIRAYQTSDTMIGELKYQRIMMPLDGSQRAECVLPLVTNLAQFHHAQILAVHVVPKPEMPRRTPLSQEDIELADQITERNRLAAVAYMDELKERAELPLDTRILISENVARTLHEEVDENKVDLVVLSAHGYSGETRWRYGRTVVSFLNYGSKPLLVYQDLPPESIQPTQAEVAAEEHGGRS